MKNNNDMANDLTDEVALQEHNNNKYYVLAFIYHIIYNKSWAQTPWLRHVASPNCRNFNKFLDFKNRYIQIFWINMTNQVMKGSSI